MKIIKIKYINSLMFTTLFIGLISCEKNLEEDVFSQLPADKILNTAGGINSLLVSAYDHFQYMDVWGTVYNYLGEAPTDIFWQTGGGHNRNAFPLINFTWDSNHSWIYEGGWLRPYRIIRETNIILENIDNVSFSEADGQRIKGEAIALRAFAYHLLFGWFGPTPLVLSSTGEDLFPKRASAEGMMMFIETELIKASSLLPLEQIDYGRITKGAVLSILTKYYLNSKQWEKCVSTSQQVIDLNKYALFPDYTTLFDGKNERNPELIMVMPSSRLLFEGNTWMAFARPPNYPLQPNQINFAAQFRYYDAFVNSFDLRDKRRRLFLTEYVNNGGILIKLLGADNSRSFKYNDPNSNAEYQDNDFVIIRYADILLSRAEALNEINGPNQEAIDLINRIRKRADIPLLELGDFTKKSLRDHFLNERKWEFYSESLRREDLIRHGKFIEQAIARGKNAMPHHILYPIPQVEMDINPNLSQNEGY